MGIKPDDLIAKFQYALNEAYGYIYGMTHEMWSKAKQDNYNKAKASNPDCQMSIKYGSKWYGHWVTDCSGLFTWAFSELGGYMYHGSNTMFNKYTTANGTLVNGKRSDGKGLIPGTAVFVYNKEKKNYSHVGLFIGDGGKVIEAKGTQAGVVRTKITDKRWTHWGELKGVDYNGGDEPVPEGYAEVTGKNVALRKAPTTQASVITRVATGQLVKLEEEPPSQWDYVSYNGKTGYMMKEFLKEG